MAGISPDRWTCPSCRDTVVRSALATPAVWARQLKRMQTEHGRAHAPRTRGSLIKELMAQ